MLTAPPRDAEVSLPALKPIIEDSNAVVMCWTVHLLRGRERRLLRITAALASVLLVGLSVFHNPVLALLPTLALACSLAEFLFPVRYTLTQRGAQARQGPVTLEIAWNDVRHAYLAPDGVKLSPLRRQNARLEPLRGVFLRFAGNDEAVITTVRRLRERGRADG